MTALANRPVDMIWSGMPGWGIVADLTPPELVAARRLRVVQKFALLGIVVVLLLCAGGYVLAFVKHSSASDSLAASKHRTSQLQAQQLQYTKVTNIQQQTQSINAQLATLTANDADVAILVAKMRDALPGTMSLTSLTVSISGAAGGTNTAASLDTSGHAAIGTVTLAGSAQHLVDLAGYVTALSELPGVANVIPASNSTGTTGAAQWNVTLQLTDALYSHPSASATPGSSSGGH